MRKAYIAMIAAGLLSHASCGEAPQKPLPSPGFTDPAALLMAELDHDGSGDLTESEFPSMRPEQSLLAADQDRDGRVNPQELAAFLETPHTFAVTDEWH